MKIQNYIYILLVSLIFQATAIAQELLPDGIPEPDPKLTLKEQLALLKAGHDNPAKAIVETDPRMIEEYGYDIQKEAGPTQYNASPIVDREPVDPEQPTSFSGSSGNSFQLEPLPAIAVKNYLDMNNKGTQPEPGKSESVINYRTISGSKDQPVGKQPENNLNYRKLKGDNKQPEGDSPGDK
ncbi:MAG: hypothetical protein JW731_08425 [Bacteroidales bacterium]|nr:hypothetical protein [Bacteroidales bacterium]